MELRGLEPLASTLPAWRSSQLSYSPFECEVVCKVNACVLSVARGRQPQVEVLSADDVLKARSIQTVLANRTQDRDPDPHRGEHDRLLRHRSFDVRVHHEHMFA